MWKGFNKELQRANSHIFSAFSFKTKDSFVELDELEGLSKFTHAWIIIPLRFHLATENNLV